LPWVLRSRPGSLQPSEFWGSMPHAGRPAQGRLSGNQTGAPGTSVVQIHAASGASGTPLSVTSLPRARTSALAPGGPVPHCRQSSDPPYTVLIATTASALLLH
jgi:hypothetical protein